jgi:hypothetical protein
MATSLTTNPAPATGKALLEWVDAYDRHHGTQTHWALTEWGRRARWPASLTRWSPEQVAVGWRVMWRRFGGQEGGRDEECDIGDGT